MTNENIAMIDRAQLEAAYEASQWALAHALHKLGGSMTITQWDMENLPAQHRVWYSQQTTDAGAQVTHVEIKEWKPNDPSQRKV